MPYGRTRRLRRSECNILPLVLKTKWFRMIESGEKKEEYRDLSRFWHIRFINFNTLQHASGKVPVVEFRLGYGKNAERHARVINMVGPTQSSCFSVASEARGWGEHWGEPKGWHFIILLDDKVEWEPEADDDICRHGRSSFIGCPHCRDLYCTLEGGPGFPKEKCHFIKRFEQLERKRILDDDLEDFDE